MTFNKKLLDIVACPVCKGRLVLHEQSCPLSQTHDAQTHGAQTHDAQTKQTDQKQGTSVKASLQNSSEPNVGGTESLTQSLVCRFDRLSYPIEDGIPVLLESDAKVLSLEELEKVKAHD
ncbi:Trm112 family protein [Glaciecola siphonariae]|uniref:Trm112 family protein n=1 Tax=Glaciecola siphonariae TaxID=521012 RepID=A0ABV9LT21_9ALTE